MFVKVIPLFLMIPENRSDTTTTLICGEIIDVPEGFNIATYFWDFGDGNTSDSINPTILIILAIMK